MNGNRIGDSARRGPASRTVPERLRRLLGLGGGHGEGADADRRLLRPVAARSAASPAAAPPTSLGRYRVESVLVELPEGAVLRAWDPKLDRPVVLRAVHLGPEADAGGRLQRMAYLHAVADTSARIGHDGIQGVFGLEYDGDWGYVILEWLEGVSLETHLERMETMPPSQVVPLAAALAGILRAAHSAGAVHGGVCPTNVLLQYSGPVKLLNPGMFGEAERFDGTDVPLHSVGYAAPEQLQGRECDELCEIFSFGAVIYRCLTGRTPYRASRPPVDGSWMGPPAVWRYRPSLTEELGGLVLRLTAGSRRSRPVAIAGAAAELARMAESHRWRWTPPTCDPPPGAAGDPPETPRHPVTAADGIRAVG